MPTTLTAEERRGRNRLYQRRRRQALRESASASTAQTRTGRTPHTPADIRQRNLARQRLRRQTLRTRNSSDSEWWTQLASYTPQTISLDWPIDRRCTKCGTKLLNVENNDSKWCCYGGTFPSQKLPPYPPQIDNLLSNGRCSDISRKLNNLFCFSAIGIDGSFVNLPSPSNVVLCGRSYHRILDVTRGQHSMRWFLYAPEERSRSAERIEVSHTTVRQIEHTLVQVNPYVAKFRFLRDQPPGVPYALELINQPSANDEIAAILHTNTVSNPSPRSVYVWRNSPDSNIGEFINILSSHYEPLQYPLIFPHGTPGWYIGKHENLTQMKYYRLRLLQNDDRFSSLGRLANEYLVDMFSRMEDERLHYKRRELIHRAGGDTNIDYRLGTGWVGSRQWASEQVADTLALCREFGRPSLFITVTTNPNWPEIKARLHPGQTASDHPGVVTRTFKARLSLMMAAISKKMGKLVYVVKVIEFQKRGLPHAHIVLKLPSIPRLLTLPTEQIYPELPLEKIDSVIKAELPDAIENPSLRAKVQKYNMHRQDHLSSPNNRCYKDGKCIYGYPKPIQQTTTLDESGRVIYRRRKEEDRMVASYMPFLTELMDCHVNVDVTFTVNIFMYLYKYLFKGPDTTRYSITDPRSEHVDEIKDYINARYVSASEATWRLFGFDITGKSPSVTTLPVHLPGENHHQMTRAGGNQSTASKLLRYFARPALTQFRELKYMEFYNQYLHKPVRQGTRLGENQWLEQPSPEINIPQIISLRVSRETISRIVFIAPRKGELFYLRTLLLHRAAYSYEDLRTVNDITYETFQEAATKFGLFADIAEAEFCLQEAISFHYAPYHLRFLFAQLIIDIPSPARELWLKYKDQISADHAQHFNSLEQAYLEALRDIQKLLTTRGADICDFGLPDPGDRIDEIDIEHATFSSRTDELLRTANDMIASFNQGQAVAFDIIYDAITQERPIATVFYLEGRAGRGKSFVAQALCAKLRAHLLLAVITGTTALSVTIYERGRTAHSTFGIPVSEINADLQSNIKTDSQRAAYLEAADLIIWEEMPMANRAAIECVDALLRAITGKDDPFGEKIFLGIGDFRQTAPVVRGAGKTETIAASIVSSPLWSHFTHLQLHEPIRNASDPEYAQWVDKIGQGNATVDETDVQLDMIADVDDIDGAIDFLYPPETLQDPELCIRNSFLSPLNCYVDMFNDTMLERLPGDEAIYYSFDSVKEEEQPMPTDHPATTSDYLSLQRENGIPMHELRLKPGCICTIMRNLDINEGLVKNRRVVVETLHDKLVEVRLIDAPSLRQTFCIPRITFEFQPKYCPWTIQRRQFPLRLAYATTFNSCQGLTLNKVVLDLRTSVFSHGQLYCSVSRVRHREACRKLMADDNKTGETKNVVYRRLLLPT